MLLKDSSRPLDEVAGIPFRRRLRSLFHDSMTLLKRKFHESGRIGF
jgi:hypothetical protein